MISALVVDDHPVMRWAMQITLEESGVIRVVGEAVNGREAVRAAGTLRPDVVVMDVAMPVLDGLSATRLLKRACPSVCVVILTAEPSREREQAALLAGASAVLGKDASGSQLLSTILDAVAA